MSALIDALPDMVALVRRDGRIVMHVGGQGVSELRRADGEMQWSDSTAMLVKQLVRRAIAQRTPVERRFSEQQREYDVRVTPQGPDRAIMVIRAVLPGASADSDESSGIRPRPHLDRRGFLRRLADSIALAGLREQPLSLAVVHLDGITDIAHVIGMRVSEQILNAVIVRLWSLLNSGSDAREQPGWYLGQLSENVLALVMHTSDRDTIDAQVTQLCSSLHEPVAVDSAEYRLTVHAGVAILDSTITSPRALLEHARAAASEARRAAAGSISFYSDTVRLRSLARLDFARELREAMENGDIRCRYVGRYDLATGRLVAWVGYVRWEHTLRGIVRPAEFLRVAASTGLAVELSQSILASLARDFTAFGKDYAPDVRISFGGLRDHLFQEHFVSDVERMLASGELPAERLELRIAEKTFITREPQGLRSLQTRGVQIVADEVGRGMSSLIALARAPLAGLQLDRSLITAVHNDAVARRVCAAGLAIAASLGVSSSALGIDDHKTRDTLLEMGCRFGSGDLYPDRPSNITAAAPAVAVIS